MEKDFQISAQVCEQLARELVTEQAELLKHEAIVENIKKAIMEKKTEIVKKVAERKLFLYGGKRFIVLGVSSIEADNRIFMMMEFCEYPGKAIGELHLTRREKELLEQYKAAFSFCLMNNDESWEHDLFSAACQLARLKNSIHLTEGRFWEFSFDEASNSDFFKMSGIDLGMAPGVGINPIMLEDAVIKHYK